MISKRFFVSLVAMFALVLFVASSVSASVTITDLEIEIAGTDVSNITVAEFSGNTVPVRVQFTADDYSEDVRVKAWFSGARGDSAVTERFDVLENRTYTKTLSVALPSDLDDDETEGEYRFNVVIESENDGKLDSELDVKITVQRESYQLDILDVDMSNEVSAGDVLALDVVVKNIGRQNAEDTFVIARIPALGVEDRAYFGDLSASDADYFFVEDDSNERIVFENDNENSNERRMSLRIPSNAPAGLYTVEVEAYNEDSVTTFVRKVVVTGASDNSMVVSSVHSKTFAAGEEQTYSLTLVNSGSKIMVYELVIDATSGLTVDVSDPVVAVPAGSSRTINFVVSADKAGKYEFTANVHSGTELVKSESYSANVEGSKNITGNATVLLTVILAIVFVVLLVVLIVLLTRKPERTEEFGESYY